MYFDPNLPYPQSFEDAVVRASDRVTSDPGTQRIADAVNARGMAIDLARTSKNNRNVALAQQRHTEFCDHDGAGICVQGGSPNVPNVVYDQIDRATACHRQTSRRPAF